MNDDDDDDDKIMRMKKEGIEFKKRNKESKTQKFVNIGFHYQNIVNNLNIENQNVENGKSIRDLDICTVLEYLFCRKLDKAY